MINAILNIPNHHDATCFYRMAGPFAQMRKTYPEMQLSLQMHQHYSFTPCMMADVAVFQRPSTAAELDAIRIFKRLGVPVIVDYDDLLFSVPTDNPAHAMYMNRETRDTIVAIVREADCVWVSTKELKRCLQLPNAVLNERVYVVPNALDDLHLVRGKRTNPRPPNERQPAVLWRGSQTHHRDVMEFAPEMQRVAEKFPQWSFVFAGWNPWFLTDVMRDKQAITSGPLPVGEFMDFVYATGPQVGMVPLHDSRFNRCKSNIAWLEMTWAGAACLVPDWEEWRNPGAVTYRTPEDFMAGLVSLLEMKPGQRDELNRMSWDHIEKNFLLSRVNGIRAATIEALVAGTGWPEGHERLEDPDTDGVMEELG
jgi:hypothetical protein